MNEFRDHSEPTDGQANGTHIMSSSFIPEATKSARQDFITRQCDHFLRACAKLNDQVPGLLFTRFTQVLLDSACSGLSVFGYWAPTPVFGVTSISVTCSPCPWLPSCPARSCCSRALRWPKLS